MMRKSRLLSALFFLQSILLFAQVNPSTFSAMKWRNIGPYRAGKVNAVAGIPGDPATFFFGANGGGVWKTTDSGNTWKPIFDSVNVAPIGAIAVAVSDPNVIYVGTGENQAYSDVAFGDGVYKTTNGGASWEHVGLEHSLHIGRILVDPGNPDVVLAAAIGDPFGPSEERGVFRSTDGGKSWTKVLYKDDVTGAVDLCFAPGDPSTVYATLWHPGVKPGVTNADPGPGAGIWKSTDEGATWKQVGGKGLPEGNLGRIGVAVAPGTQGKRVFAIVEAKGKGNGLYVTNDGGDTWERGTTDDRILGYWYMSEIFVDPRDANTVYVPRQSFYKSSDGGKTFTVTKGAPGGDDYHTMWIDPTNSAHMILGVDQGATITLNGGKTWSTWYNQPTGQFYRVATDHQFPYWVYGPQQDSGTAGVSSRGNDGQITERDWFPVGPGESGYTIPDPVDPDVVYNAGPFGSVVRLSKRTGQVRDISPAPIQYGSKYRFNWNIPLVFSPKDTRTLYLGTQYVMKTLDHGTTWEKISPDLTRVQPPPDEDKKPKDPNAPKKSYGSIMSMAPSPLDTGVMWVSTNDGAVQLTRNGGKAWTNVTPAAVSEWSTIPLVEASHFDPATAYIAVNRNVLDDRKPHIFQTHDYGKSWQETVAGICDECVVRSVRQDPVNKSLLYAGTEKGVYFSLDDGAHWQSLRLNMPMAAAHDLAIEQGDLVVATYGRGFWILDDLTPLRDYDPKTVLYKPLTATRVRRDENQDTPLPPEVPAGKNPPAGVILYYALPANSGVKLEIHDAAGKLVRSFSSDPLPNVKEDPLQIAEYWVEHPEPMPKGAGLHRFVWDLRYPDPPAVHVMTPYNYPMGAIVGETPLPPLGPLVVPGNYEVQMTVDGKTYRQPLTVRMDPRVTADPKALDSSRDLQLKISATLARNYAAFQQVKELREKLAELAKAGDTDPVGKAAAELDKKAGALLGESVDVLEVPDQGTFATVNDSLIALIALVDGADAVPSAESFTAHERLCVTMNAALRSWHDLKAKDLAQFRAMAGAKASGIPEYPEIAGDTGCKK